MRLSLPALAALASLVTTAASATDEQTFIIDTGADLARLCATAPDNPLYGQAIHMCHGYIVSVHHLHTAYSAAGIAPIYCLEAAGGAPSRNEAAAAYVAWIQATPGVGEAEAVESLMTWASRTYPCPAE